MSAFTTFFPRIFGSGILREINVDFVCSHLIEPDFTLNYRELDLQKGLITLVVISMVVHW